MTVQADTTARVRADTTADYSIEAHGLVKTYPLPGKAPGNRPRISPGGVPAGRTRSR